MSVPPAGSTLLDLLEHRWRRHLAAGQPAGTLDVEPEMLDAVALALGDLARSEPPMVLKRRWPACIVVAVAQITARYDKNGKVWPAWFRATRTRAANRSAADWAEAFADSLATLGAPVPRQPAGGGARPPPPRHPTRPGRSRPSTRGRAAGGRCGSIRSDRAC